MKTLKLKLSGFILITLLVTLAFGCKKDDSNPASGYFTLDGTKHDLLICYKDESSYEDQFFLAFIGNGINFKGFDSSTTGKGAIFFIAVKVPKGETGAVTGTYTYQSEPAWAVPFNYNDAMYESADFDSGDMGNEMEINDDVVLNITKSGNTYKFSAKGEIEVGVPFEFYYNGTVSSL